MVQQASFDKTSNVSNIYSDIEFSLSACERIEPTLSFIVAKQFALTPELTH